VRKEFPGGLIAEMEVTLPAVLGVQASERPPAYVAFSKIRQAMKSSTIEDQPADKLNLMGGSVVERMFKPESGTRARMIEGDVNQVAEKLVGILEGLGVLRGG
jgi:electron transfer flavoprotein beta subunit